MKHIISGGRGGGGAFCHITKAYQFSSHGFIMLFQNGDHSEWKEFYS